MNANTDTDIKKIKSPINEIIVDEKIKNNVSEKKGANIIYLIFKEIIDIIAGIIGIIILIPIALIVKISNIKNKDYEPLFYSQPRIGKDGKNFKMYKFRSMVVNADDILSDYLDDNPNEKAEYIKYKKLKHDPRVTRTGEFLRKTSLDEWPQFINILKGDMSLVGNRPYLLREKEEMGEDFDSIEKYKPGLTGLWQTSGRSNLKFVDRINIEKEYVPTLVGDIKIICATVQKVLKRDGAI